MISIHPSLISSKILELQQQIQLLEPYSDAYHLDVMDFHFVSNLTWGPVFINAIKDVTKKPLYIHLMVSEPEKYLSRMHLSQGDTVSFHLEACSMEDAKNLIKSIKNKNLKASIALKPSTPLDKLTPFLPLIDDVLLMSVEPGFSGQKFIYNSVQRLKELICLKKNESGTFSITMDGGINETNIKELYSLGANQFGIASGIFEHKNPVKAILNLRKICTE